MNGKTETNPGTRSSVPENPAPENPTPEATPTSLTEERVDLISETLGQRGHAALVVTALNKEDRKNVVREAVDLKLKEKPHKLTHVPIIGSAVKAGWAYVYKKQAEAAVNREGNYEAAFNRLELSPTKSRILTGSTASTNERAWQMLEGADFQNTTSRLDQNEKVEKIEGKAEELIKQAYNEYYAAVHSAIKSGTQPSKELDRIFDEQVKAAAAGDKGLASSLHSIYDQKANIIKLAQDDTIQAEEVKTYVNQHLTLYKADTRVSAYTKQKNDNIINAVMDIGLGGVVYAASTRKGRTALRHVVGTAAGAGLTGAAVGGIFGAAKGLEKANIKLSQNELKNLTSSELEKPKSTTETPEAEATDSIKNQGTNTGDQVKAEAKQNKIRQVMNFIGNKKRKLTKEEQILKEITDKRDHQPASKFIEGFEDLLKDYNPEDEASSKKLLDLYADTLARSQFSIQENVDLITYQNNKSALEQQLGIAEKFLFTDKGQSVETLLDDENSDLKKAIDSKLETFAKNQDAIKKLEREFRIRSAVVDGIQGAIIGGVAGGLFHAISDSEAGEFLKQNIGNAAGVVSARAGDIIGEAKEKAGNIAGAVANYAKSMEGYAESGELSSGDNFDTIEPIINADGSATYEIDGHTFNDLEFKDGVLTDDSIREIKDTIPTAMVNEIKDFEKIPQDIQTSSITAREFFDLDPNDTEANGELMHINPNRAWMVADNGGNKVGLDEGWPYREDDGSIVMQFVPKEGENINFEDTRVFFTAGNDAANTGIAIDVGADGKVRIPSDSPLVQMFDDNGYYKGQAELIHETDNATEVYYTLGNNNLDLDSHITVPNTGEVRPTFTNEITYQDATTGEVITKTITPPEDSAMIGEINAHRGAGVIKGLEDVKRVASEALANATSETATLSSATVDGVPVSNLGTLDIREHIGGYRASENPFHDPSRAIFDGEKYSGASVPRKILGDAAKGLSNEEINSTVLEKLQDPNSDLTVDQFTEAYLEDISKSPESIVRMHVLLEDGDDENFTHLGFTSMGEINEYANELANGPAEEYDKFVNETMEKLCEKVDGGSIRVINYAHEDYQYTTYSELIGSDIRQYTQIKSDACDGIGLEFLDKNGNSVYNYDTARSIWQIPRDQEITHIAERTNCQQETVEVEHPSHPGRPGSGDEGSGDEPSGDEPSGDERSGDEGSGDEPSGDEPSGDEPSGDEPSGDEPSGDEPSGDEPSGDEPSGDEPSGDEPSGDEPSGDEPSGDETTGKTDHNITSGDDTDLPVTPDKDNFVEGGGDNSVDPNTTPGSQVTSQPTDNSAFHQSDKDTSSGSDTTSSYSQDTSKWQGDKSGGGGGGDTTPSKADPGSAEKNVEDRSDEDLANILKGEE